MVQRWTAQKYVVEEKEVREGEGVRSKVYCERE